MAKNVELLSYYDSQRAMFRELYTYENNRFKHAIGKCEYWNDKLFSELHTALYKGLYENCGGMLKGNHITDELNYLRRLPSSVTMADYMGAIELKFNCEAMFIAANHIFNALKKGKVPYNKLIEICYNAGKRAGRNLRYVKKSICPSDFNTPAVQIKNASSLVKKFDKGLKLGHVPEELKLITPLPKRYDELELLRRSTISSYSEMIKELNRLGINDLQLIKNLFGVFNQGYYATSLVAFKAVDVEGCKGVIDDHFYRLSDDKRLALLKKEIKDARYYPESRVTDVIDPFTILIKDDYYKYLTREEIKCIMDKYCWAILALKDIEKATYKDLYKVMFASGEKARDMLVTKEGLLPEMMGGFYLCFTKIQKLILAEKETEKKVISAFKSKTKTTMQTKEKQLGD